MATPETFPPTPLPLYGQTFQEPSASPVHPAAEAGAACRSAHTPFPRGPLKPNLGQDGVVQAAAMRGTAGRGPESLLCQLVE